jgi:hypothetical protein
MGTTIKLSLCALLILALSACAAGTDASHQAAHAGALSEIILGFWHGLIAPIALIGEVIDKLAPKALPWSFRFYEIENSGVIYDVGFFVGLVAGPTLLWHGASRRR